MGGVPYGIVLLVATGVLAFRHVRTDRASPRSRWVVGCIAFLSVIVSASWPLTAAVVQLSICVYVIIHRVVTDELAKSGKV